MRGESSHKITTSSREEEWMGIFSYCDSGISPDCCVSESLISQSLTLFLYHYSSDSFSSIQPFASRQKLPLLLQASRGCKLP